MAWQLIYTSSPRLLEAGRTGFGTVAKHRAIGSLLTGSLEGISQFARLAGYDPNRIIYTHRILQAGSTRFNVLSCLRDAGSDYTGRTNHIAQHLIATASEVAELIQHGVTPADILFGMDWKSCWEGDARYLEISDEVKLSSATPFSYNAWTSLTGLADHSRLPWSAAAEKGCYLVVPASMDPRQIVGEALHQYPQRAWEITFTTHLEPNDALGDFKWICLPPDSPARAQVESSSRTTFNLSQPANLPAPPPIKRALIHLPLPVEMQARPEKQVTFAPPPSGLDPASTWGMNMLGPSQAGLNMKGHDSATTRPKSSKGLLVLAALSLVMMLALGAVLYIKKDKADKKALADQWRTSCWEKVCQWKSNNLQLTESRKYLFEKFLKESHDPKLQPENLSYFRDFETFFKSVPTALGNGGSTPIELPLNSGPAQAELLRLKESADNWILASKKLQGVIKPWSTWDAVNKNMTKEKECWDDLKSHYSPPPEARAVFIKIFVNNLLDLLQHTDQKLEDYDIAMEVLKGLLVPEDQRPKWLAHWRMAWEAKKNKGKLGMLDVGKMNKDNPPPWLKKDLVSLTLPEYKTKLQIVDSPIIEPRSPHGMSTPPSKPPEQSSPTVATGLGYPIYVASVKDFSEGELAKLPSLPMQEQMTLQVLPMGTATQPLLTLVKRGTGITSGLLNFAVNSNEDKEKCLAFQAGKLTQIPDTLASGELKVQTQQDLRLKAMSMDKKPLFELYLKTPNTPASEYLLPTEMPQAELKNQEFRVRLGSWLQRIHSVDDTVLAYRLTNNTNNNSKQIHYDLSPLDDGKVWWEMNLLAPPNPKPIKNTALIKDLISKKKAADEHVQAAEREIQENNSSKIAILTKAARDKTNRESLSRAVQEAEKAKTALDKAQLPPQPPPAPPNVKPEKGRYRLSVRGITGSAKDGFIDLCIVELN